MGYIVIRHDIVHRGGKTKEGSHVEITSDKLSELRHCIASFVEKIEGELTSGNDFKF